jgi:glucose-1-phosphate adenylyltransferase
MDPRQMLEEHLETDAGVTVAGIRVPIEQASSFGIIERGDSTLIEQFREKPSDPVPLPDDPSMVLASMGNYIFKTDVLLDLIHEDSLNDDSKHDVGGDLIPALVDKGVAHVYDFTTNAVPGVTEREHAYWRDVGTLDSYFDAHMDLVSVEPVFNLYNTDWPIFTSDVVAPPAKVVAVAEHGAGHVADSILSNGVVISGGYVRSSVLSPWVRIDPGAVLEGTVLLEDVIVGEGAQLRNVIVDKNVQIPPGARIGFDPDRDRERGFEISDGGVVAVAKNTVITEPE